MHLILDFITSSFIDIWLNFPILFLLYFFLEWYGHSKGYNFLDKIKTNKIYTPIIGALLGIIPQCGMSVLFTGIYLRGLISTGTLISVYISTSDEAIPVMLSNIQNSEFVFIIILVKFIFASIIGIIVDFFIPNIKVYLKTSDVTLTSKPIKIEPVHSAGKHNWQPTKIKILLTHAFKHSIIIFNYIFIFALAMNIINYYYEITNLYSFIINNEFYELIVSSMIGLIPNCIASVAISYGFLNYGLSFGSTIAGLSTAAGVGLIVLIKEVQFKTYYKIILLLILSSILIGFTVNRIYKFNLEPKNIKIENIHSH